MGAGPGPGMAGVMYASGPAEQGRLPGLLPGGRGDADGPEGSEWFLPEFIIFFSKIGVGRIDGLCLLLS